MKYTKEQRDFLFGQIDHALVFKTGLELNPTRVEILSEWLHEMENELQRLQESERWIPVSERLPEDKGEYLCYLKPDIFTCFFGDSWNGTDAFRSVIAPTHWRPFPQPPEEIK